MDKSIRFALKTNRTIDITTKGRRSGQPRRIEIWFHQIGGKTYITGTPGKRDWYANLEKHPNFIFHLKGSMIADLPANARPINATAERAQVLTTIVRRINESDTQSEYRLDECLARSPLVEVVFDN